MASVSIDASELRTLAADMTGVDGRLARHIRPVLSKAALNIKQDSAKAFQSSGNAGFRYVGSTVSYDIEQSSSEVSAEIGPSKPAGALANVAIFGTSRGGGTVPDLTVALAAEAPNLEKYLGDLAEELIW